MKAYPKIAERAVFIEDDEDNFFRSYLNPDKARNFAHELLLAAEKVDGKGCFVAAFTIQGEALSPQLKEDICKWITTLTDEQGQIEGVLVLPGGKDAGNKN